MTRSLATAAALTLLALSPTGLADSADERSAVGPVDEQWRFRVMLDDKPIGYHRFEVREQGDMEVVDIEARFEVEVLFVTAYRYKHDNQETWRGECLQAIRSTTDDNGERFEVRGKAGDGAFTLERNDSEEDVQAECLKTFAYWNPDILQADRLLNAQTGEVKPVNVRSVGATDFEFDGATIPSDEYVIEAPDGDIRLWYQADNRQWLGLETRARGDRTLRYVPESLPQPPESVAAVVNVDADLTPRLSTP